MKRLKKACAFLLSAAIMLGMSIGALAEETKTYTYEIYQIFTGDYYEGILSNVKWGQNGTGTTGTLVDKDTLDALEKVTSSTSDSEKLDVIRQYANLTGTAYKEVTGTEDTTTVSDLPNGYYLVKDKDNSVSGNDVYTTYVVQVVDKTLTIERKGSIPSVDKEILDTDAKKTNEASIGDTVNYQITGTMPTNLADYKTYYYSFTDTLSKGLTYTSDSLKVTVDSVDLTDYFYKSVGTYSETDGTTITVSIQDLLALNLLKNDNDEPLVNITKDSKVVITYSATLNENAVIGKDPNTNDVLLDYSNDPNNSGSGSTIPDPNPDEPTKPNATGETPKSTVETYTTELTILKQDENGNVLTGAEFTLTGEGVNVVLVTSETFEKDENGTYYKLADGTYTTEAPTDVYDSLTEKYSLNANTGEYESDPNGIYWKLKDGTYTEEDPEDMYDSLTDKYTKKTTVTAKGTGKTETNIVGTVGDDGTVTFTGLGAGDYTITETKTPSGYNTIEPIKFTITFNADTKKFASDNESVKVEENNTLSATIVNESGTMLPTTGGIGTTIFYVIGTILVVGAGVLLIVKKRMSGTEE